MSVLNRLATFTVSEGSNPKPCDRPSSPVSQRVKRYGMIAWRLSPSTPAQPHQDRDCRSAGPPREQRSQKEDASALPPSPKCSHTLFLSCMCELTLPPSS